MAHLKKAASGHLLKSSNGHLVRACWPTSCDSEWNNWARDYTTAVLTTDLLHNESFTLTYNSGDGIWYGDGDGDTLGEAWHGKIVPPETECPYGGTFTDIEEIAISSGCQVTGGLAYLMVSVSMRSVWRYFDLCTGTYEDSGTWCGYSVCRTSATNVAVGQAGDINPLLLGSDLSIELIASGNTVLVEGAQSQGGPDAGCPHCGDTYDTITVASINLSGYVP